MSSSLPKVARAVVAIAIVAVVIAVVRWRTITQNKGKLDEGSPKSSEAAAAEAAK